MITPPTLCFEHGPHLTPALGDDASCVGSLRTLNKLLDEYGGGDALHLVSLSAIAEAATSLAESGDVKRGVELISAPQDSKKRRASKGKAISFRERLKLMRDQVEVPRLETWLDELQERADAWVVAPEDAKKRESLLRHAMRYPG